MNNAKSFLFLITFALLLTGCGSREEKFLKACRYGDLSIVQKYAHMVNVNCSIGPGLSGLMLSARYGHEDVVNYLLEIDADPFQKNEHGQSSFDGALTGGNTNIINSLMTHILASKNDQLYEEALVSLCTANTSYVNYVKSLLSKGVSPNSRGGDNWTVLMSAAWRGHKEICELLLHAGADPNLGTTDSNGTWPIIVATTAGHKSVVELLIKYDADCSVTTKDNNHSALMQSIYLNRADIAKILLAAGCKVNDADLSIPFSYLMATQGKYEMARVLLEYGAENQFEIDGVTIPFPLYLKAMEITNFPLDGLSFPASNLTEEEQLDVISIINDLIESEEYRWARGQPF